MTQPSLLLGTRDLSVPSPSLTLTILATDLGAKVPQSEPALGSCLGIYGCLGQDAELYRLK